MQLQTQPRILPKSNKKKSIGIAMPNIETPSSDDEVPIPVTNKRRRLIKNGSFANNNVKSSDDENSPKFADKNKNNEDIQKEGAMMTHGIISDNDKPTEDIHNYKQLIDDEAGEDLYDSDMYNVTSIFDGDDKDTFINDDSTNYYSTDDEDTEDDF
nr:hypothetical protein [Tanacetum cinerariifolium]